MERSEAKCPNMEHAIETRAEGYVISGRYFFAPPVDSIEKESGKKQATLKQNSNSAKQSVISYGNEKSMWPKFESSLLGEQNSKEAA